MLKNEIKRAFTGKGMLLALVIGLGIIVAYQLDMGIKIHNNMNKIKESGIYIPQSKTTPFDIWIPGHATKYQIYFYYFMPVLAALPFGSSYAREKKSGYVKNVVYRAGKNGYVLSKTIASCIAGGAALALPLLLNLMWTFTIESFKMPSPAGNQVYVNGVTAFGEFFFDHPFIYCFVYIILTFVFGGAVALLSLAMSSMTDNYFTVLLTPFILYMILETVVKGDYSHYLPYTFLSPTCSGDMLLYGFGISISVMILGGLVFAFSIKRSDCL